MVSQKLGIYWLCTPTICVQSSLIVYGVHVWIPCSLPALRARAPSVGLSQKLIKPC